MPQAECIRGTNSFNMNSNSYTWNSSTVFPFLGRKALLLLLPHFNHFGYKRNSHTSICCCVASTLARTQSNTSPVNYGVLNISKAQLFPIWIKWCFISSDWIFHYSSKGMGKLWAVKCQFPSLCSQGEEGIRRGGLGRGEIPQNEPCFHYHFVDNCTPTHRKPVFHG